MKSIWKRCMAASIALAIGAAAAAEGASPGDKPLVVNGDLSLTTSDFDAYMERVPRARRDEFRAENEKVNPTIDALWLRRVTAARARAAGLDNDPLVQARIRLAVEDVLSEVYMADVERKIKVPNLEARARELYKVHQKDFVIPDVVTAQHILVSTKTYPRDKAKARAEEVLRRAQAGEDFAKLAAEYTDNKASIEIKEMGLPSLAPPLPEAVRKAKAGEIVGPVETQYGFHVMKVNKLVPSRVKPYEDVREDLIAVEKQKYIDEEKTAVAEAIRADPKNHLYVENVRGLKSDFKIPSAEELSKIKPNVRY